MVRPPTPSLAAILGQYVCVLLTDTSGIDFSALQFDRDLALAAFFMNADQRIYGRFGTRSILGKNANVRCKLEPDLLEMPSQDVTLAGFEKAAAAALELHRAYVRDAASLERALRAKTGPPLPWKDSNSIPALQSWRRRTDEVAYAGPGSNSCIHCHHFAVGTLESLRREHRPIPDAWVWPFPMPNLLGFSLDPEERATVQGVTPGSEAERAGLRPGDDIVRMEGQPILSVADVQWVLHQAKEPGRVELELAREGARREIELSLPEGWRRRGSIAWRVSMVKAEGDMLGLIAEELEPPAKQELGLGSDDMALKVVDFHAEDLLGDGHRSRNRAAEESGIQRGDVIVAVDGKRKSMNRSQLIAYAIQHKSAGDSIALEVKRGGATSTFRFRVGPAETLE